MKRILYTFTLLVLSIFLMGAEDGCGDSSRGTEADHADRAYTERLMTESQKEVTNPDIHNFQEKRFFKQILEQRDQSFTTYTYTRNEMTGQPVLFCESVGYGLPASTQYTNPSRPHELDVAGENAGFPMPQPDPNGLFMPTSSSATYVLCTDPSEPDGFDAQYVESQITVVTKPLRNAETRYSLDTSAPQPSAPAGVSEGQ